VKCLTSDDIDGWNACFFKLNQFPLISFPMEIPKVANFLELETWKLANVPNPFLSHSLDFVQEVRRCEAIYHSEGTWKSARRWKIDQKKLISIEKKKLIAVTCGKKISFQEKCFVVKKRGFVEARTCWGHFTSLKLMNDALRTWIQVNVV
jgi:hypothetical protein